MKLSNLLAMGLMAILNYVAFQIQAADPVKVAVLGYMSLTDANGVQTQWVGMQGVNSMFILAMKHFNERDGRLVPKFAELGDCNKTLELITGKIMDDHGKATDAISASLPSILDGLKMVFGAVRSAVTVPLSITFGALNVPVVSHYATSQALSNREIHPMFTRTILSDVSVAHVMAKAFKQWQLRRVGMLYLQDEFGAGWKDALFSELEHEDIQLVSVPFLDTTGEDLTKSLDNSMRLLARENLNVIVVIYLNEDTLFEIAKTATARNLTSKHGKLWVFNDQGYPSSSHPDFDILADFLNETVGLKSTIPGYKNTLANPAWDELEDYLLNDVTADDVNWAFPTETIPGQGEFLIDDNWFANNIANRDSSWAYTYDTIALAGIALCSVGGPNYIPTGKEWYDQMIQTNFQGISGEVKFTNGDRDPSTAAYLMSNPRLTEAGELDAVTVGGFDPVAANWIISSDITFPGGSNVPPLDVTPPEHDLQLLGEWAKAIGYAEVAVIFICAIGWGTWLMLNRKEKIIVNSQPVFLLTLIIGCMLSGMAIIPLTIDDQDGIEPADAACMAFPWTFGVGLAISIVSLMAKSYRISVIFNNSKFRRITATASKFMTVVLFVVCIECAVLIAWTLVAPLEFERIIDFANQYDYPVSSHGICLGPAPASGAFVGLLCGLHAVQVLMLMRVTSRLTKVPARFQETRWINLAVFSMGQLYIIGLPSAAAVYNSPLGRFLVLSSIVFFTNMSLLFSIFYPKYMMQKYGEDYFNTTQSSITNLNQPISGDNNSKNSAKVGSDNAFSPLSARIATDGGVSSAQNLTSNNLA